MFLVERPTTNRKWPKLRMKAVMRDLPSTWWLAREYKYKIDGQPETSESSQSRLGLEQCNSERDERGQENQAPQICVFGTWHQDPLFDEQEYAAVFGRRPSWP